MTERKFQPLRLATMAAVVTGIGVLGACAESEPARSSPATTPESNPAPAAESTPGAEQPAPLHGDRAAPGQTGAEAERGTQPGAPQGAPPQGAGAEAPPAEGTAEPVTDDEVDAFVEVQLELEAERRELMAEAQEDGADVAELQRQLEQRAEDLVDESPLSLTRFQHIGQQLMRDPDLEHRVRESMQEQAGG